MHNALTTPLHETASMVLEQMAFLCSVAVEAELPVDAGDGIVGVDFAGPYQGRLLVSMATGTLPTFAANMIGADEPPPEDVQRDALGELANVICGNLLPRVTENNPVFDLSTPQSYASWEAAFGGVGERVAHVTLNMDRGRADVVFCRN
ncbi:MAG: chemotaxis protein CheX [Gemmatimonadaceae bacterium]